MAEEKDRPLFVTIVAILYFIGALILIIGGILIALGTIAASAVSAEPIMGLTGAAMGAVCVVMGIIYLIIAGGLWNGWKIMWSLGVIFSALSALLGIVTILASGFAGIVGILINLLILFYLFRSNVKEFFGI